MYYFSWISCIFIFSILTIYFVNLYSPSLSLVMIVLMTSLLSLLTFLKLNFSIFLIMIMLTIIGGLFILISYVVMALPADYDFTSLKGSKTNWLSLMVITLTFCLQNNFSWNHFLCEESEKTLISSPIISLTSGGFIFFLLLLVLLLKSINSLTLMKGGAMFSLKSNP